MKSLILAIATTSILFYACNNGQKNESTTTQGQNTKKGLEHVCTMHPEIRGKKGDKCSKCGMELTEEVKKAEYNPGVSHRNGGESNKVSANQEEMNLEIKQKSDFINDFKQPSYSLEKVYMAYFSLKDALTNDDGEAAQSASKSLFNKIASTDESKMNKDEKATWSKYKEKLSRDAASIKEVNENELQRKYFQSLSKNMYEVMKVIKNNQTVYYQHCPMANEGKGANWLSLKSKINNPYYGASMSTCGKTVETLK